MNLLILSDDLLISSRISGVATPLGLSLRQSTSLENMQILWKDFPADAVVVDLMLTDLDVKSVTEWLRSCNNSVTVIAFCPHVFRDKIIEAKQADCNQVYVRGEFLSQLPSIIAQTLSVQDKDSQG